MGNSGIDVTVQFKNIGCQVSDNLFKGASLVEAHQTSVFLKARGVYRHGAEKGEYR
jgi:hypothetical protein